MINVLIKTDSHYKVNRKRIRKCIEKVLFEKNVSGNVEISVSIVGDRMMKGLNLKYRKISETTDVLSFPLMENIHEAPFIDTPDGFLRLGDIVISYPEAVDEAGDENMMVDDKIDELVTHSMYHLLGIHHE
jgi:probable rRNA maturation factor